ncbi:Hypothetical predicted protein [Drosophila guanche]|uniref:Uncharacterized protein n=1 Tax=Drosophila guanche TaxID=7266 RepID=A0A3B0KM64_DROGU|nr:Hypothetical predicted protein [Drosophila guanche]
MIPLRLLILLVLLVLPLLLHRYPLLKLILLQHYNLTLLPKILTSSWMQKQRISFYISSVPVRVKSMETLSMPNGLVKSVQPVNWGRIECMIRLSLALGLRPTWPVVRSWNTISTNA